MPVPAPVLPGHAVRHSSRARKEDAVRNSGQIHGESGGQGDAENGSLAPPEAVVFGDEGLQLFARQGRFGIVGQG